MLRRLVLALMFVSAFWQAFAIAGQMPAFSQAEEIEHAMLHWQEAAHHHHDDGSLSLDDSDESAQHVTADGVLGSAAVWSIAAFTFTPAESLRPVVTAEATPPWPLLDGLRRPPRLTT